VLYLHSKVKHLLNRLNTGSRQEISTEINRLFDDIFKKNLSYDNLLQLLNQLIADIVRFLADNHIQADDLFGSDRNIYAEFMQKETMDEMKAWISELFMQIYEYLDSAKNDRGRYINRILEYIQNNYKKDIGIHTLAENVGISYSYVRKIFKDEMGNRS